MIIFKVSMLDIHVIYITGVDKWELLACHKSRSDKAGIV